MKSKYITKNESAIRYKEEKKDFRTDFFRDIDRIIYSQSYLRYADKTQVFTFEENDHIATRIIHVQYVSKIARTIGRSLGLNEDLIEAAALGHDIGHTPFGHDGEKILNEISLKKGCGFFNHNVNSFRVLTKIENDGKGLNLTYQVLDAILCHNGEENLLKYEYVNKTKEELYEEFNTCYKKKIRLTPCTLEGCVVRISDVIAYAGKDVEDAEALGKLDSNLLPDIVKEKLGKTNKEIINTIIKDIINNSIGQNYIKISDDIYKALNELVKFNYKNIYNFSYTSVNKDNLRKEFNMLYDRYLEDIENNNEASNIVNYLKTMSIEYNKYSNSQKIIDYIAGMTDTYFKKEVKKVNKQ